MIRTRRTALVLVLAVAIIGLPVLPASSGQRPTVEVRDHLVRQWQAAAGWHVAEPVSTQDVQVVGASWAGEDVEVEWRLRVDGGWSDWRHFEHPEHAAEGPDDHSDEKKRAKDGASMPVPVGGSEQIQVRSSAPADVSLELVEVDDNGYRPASQDPNAASAAAANPSIRSRSEWDPGNECAPRATPRYAPDVRYGIVHHTAGSNNYSQADAWKQVLGVCKYHRNSLGWDDVGYNFLVDKYGTIYEGRAGGMQHAVVGAHTAGFNSGSVGVSALGCFGGCGGSADISPPQAMKDALVRVMAWKFDIHHIDPKGTTTEISGGGGTTTIPEDEIVTLPTIIGHKDVAAKACPGDHLYPWVRDQMPDVVRSAMDPALYGGPRARDEQPVIGERPRWNVKVDPSSTWTLEIRNGNGDLVRTTSGVGGSLDRRWDLRDAAGSEVAPGTYRARLTAPNARPIETAFEVVPAVERRYGNARIETAIELSQWAFDDPVLTEQRYPQSEEVIIASAEAYPDALVATTLAGSYRAPILLSRSDHVPQLVVDEIRRLGATEAYVIGGPHRLRESVMDQLRGLGLKKVERLAGETRYDTAGRVAWRVIEEEDPDEVLLALGQHPDPRFDYQDALVAGAFGGSQDLPLLLVHPNAISDATQWVLEQRSWSDGVTIVGGRGTITDGVRSAARQAAPRATFRELAGDDAYGTSKVVADELLERWSEGPRNPNSYSDGLEVVLATGENWPDSLGAGAAAAARGATFLLVHNQDLDASAPSRDWLGSHAADLVHAVAAGGPEAIWQPVLDQTESIIRSAGPHTAPRETW